MSDNSARTLVAVSFFISIVAIAATPLPTAPPDLPDCPKWREEMRQNGVHWPLWAPGCYSEARERQRARGE